MNDISKINTVKLHDNDVIVVHAEAHLSSQQVLSIVSNIQKAFGADRKVVVLDGGLRLDVVSESKIS